MSESTITLRPEEVHKQYPQAHAESNTDGPKAAASTARFV
jgi:hypothetical protein